MLVKRSQPGRRPPSPPQSPPHRYRLAGWRRWLMWALFGPMLAAGVLLLGADDDTRAAGAALTLVGTAILAAWEWLWRYTVLELSPEGIRLRQLGYTLETPWSNVAAFHAVPMREGFILAQPLPGRGAQRLAAYSGVSAYGSALYDGHRIDLLAERRLIPIDAFARHLHHGAMKADLLALAPHLSDTMNAPAVANAPATPAARRQRRWLALVIAALVLLSVTLAFMQPAAMAHVADVLYAFIAPLAVLQAGISAWQMLRARNWLLAALMGAMTLVAVAWCLVAWGRFL